MSTCSAGVAVCRDATELRSPSTSSASEIIPGTSSELNLIQDFDHLSINMHHLAGESEQEGHGLLRLSTTRGSVKSTCVHDDFYQLYFVETPERHVTTTWSKIFLETTPDF